MDCPICLKSISNGIVLDCSHNFCFNCIKNWELTSPKTSCPICRADFNIDNSKLRMTRSMSRLGRLHDMQSELIILVNDAFSQTGNQKIDKIHALLCILYNNRWFLKYHGSPYCYDCNLLNSIKTKLDQFENEGWAEATMWKYKFRDILNKI